MSPLPWIPAVLTVWSLLSLATAMIAGPFLRSCSEAREAVDDSVRATLEMDVHPS